MVEAKSGENNPMYGRYHTAESKQKISEALKSSTLLNNRGINNPMYGRHHTEETKLKISEGHKGQVAWNRGKKCPEASKKQMGKNNSFYGRRHSDESKRKMCAAILERVFSVKDTSIEVALQGELNRRKIEYKKHIPVCNVCLPDIVFPVPRVAVFADGNYWHSKDFNAGEVWRRDRRQDRILRDAGWTVLRFWEHEIRDDVSRCVDEVEGVIGCVVNH